MPFDVHSLMQEPNHIDRVIRFHGKTQREIQRGSENTRRERRKFAPFFCRAQRFDGAAQITVMVLCLLRSPTLSSLVRHTRNASANFTQYDAPVGNAASLKS